MARDAGRARDEYLWLYAREGFRLRLVAAAPKGLRPQGGVLLATYDLRRPTADIDFAALNTANDVEAVRSMVFAVADIQLPEDRDDGSPSIPPTPKQSRSAKKANTAEYVSASGRAGRRRRRGSRRSQQALEIRSGHGCRPCTSPA